MKTKLIYISFFVILQIMSAQYADLDLSFRREKSLNKTSQQRLYKKALNEITRNQTKYDVIYYDLQLALDIDSERINGQILIRGEVLSEDLSKLELNFWQPMHVSSITTADSLQNQLEYEHRDDILEVDLDSSYAREDKFGIMIQYSGDPTNNPYRDFAFDVYNERPMIWTLNEPFGARAWFPCKDVPSDKADSMDIRVTVPTGLEVASNGFLRSKTAKGDSTTFWWHEQYPIATYLVSLAIYPYRKFSDWYVYGEADSMEVQYYVFPDNYNQRVVDYQKTVAMIEYFSTVFGEYPFVKEKYGHAEFLWGGGMEHQTISSMGGASELLISHELAHQWWGDAVTCHSFHDLWLNEGFASYSEALWFEFAHPEITASDYQKFSEYFGPGSIYIDDVATEPLFDVGLRYNKASWVLHMLRRVVGDDVFFYILQTYYHTNKYKTATTADFIEVCQQVSGQNLDKFFQQWVFGEYYPQYSYFWNWAKSGNEYLVNLNITQEQRNTGLFWMPIDIQISAGDEKYNFTVWDSTRTQNFEFTVAKKPIDLQLDPNNWILKKIDQLPFIVNEFYPERYQLYQNYPNPFNQSTRILFYLPNPVPVQLNVYNLAGQKVAAVLDEEMLDGLHNIKFQTNTLPSGLYFYRIKTPTFAATKKMMLLK